MELITDERETQRGRVNYLGLAENAEAVVGRERERRACGCVQIVVCERRRPGREEGGGTLMLGPLALMEV